MFKLDVEKAVETEIKLPTSVGSLKKQEFQKNSFCFIDYAKVFDYMDHINCVMNILKENSIKPKVTCRAQGGT